MIVNCDLLSHNVFFNLIGQLKYDYCNRRHPDITTERECQLTTARANQATGLTNGRAANWAPEVVFSPFRTLSRRQLTFPSCY